MRSRWSFGMPQPVSLTASLTPSPSREASIETRPSEGVASRAFMARARITCWTWAASQTTFGRSGSTRVSRVTLSISAWCLSSMRQRSTTGERSSSARRAPACRLKASRFRTMSPQRPASPSTICRMRSVSCRLLGRRGGGGARGELPAQEAGVGADAGQRVVDLVGHHRGQLAERGHLLDHHHLAVGVLELARLLVDALLEGAVQPLELLPGALELAGHLVPGAGELAHLVRRAHGDARREVAVPGPLHGDAQPLHRAHHEGPQEQQEAQAASTASHRGDEAVLHLALGGREGGVDLRHRELDVEDAEHALGGGVHVAGGALRLVVDGRDDAEDALPSAARSIADAVLALEAGLRLRRRRGRRCTPSERLSTRRALLRRGRRRPGRGPPCCRRGRGRRPPGRRCSR